VQFCGLGNHVDLRGLLVGARMGSKAPGLGLGNENLQCVSMDASRRRAETTREANEKPSRNFVKFREGAVKSPSP
jgi:hypothetical protein